MPLSNQFSQTLNIQYPIIQAPMLGVSTPEMAAAVSNEGGLGSLPIGGLSPDASAELINKTKTLTAKPFSINFFAHDIPEVDIAEAEKMQDLLDKLCREHEIPYEKEDVSKLRFYSYKDQVDVLLEAEVQSISFTFGVPDDATIKAFKQKKKLLVGSATSLREAQILDAKGIDMICAQGIEAGGHRGTFITDEPLPQVGLISLVSQIRDKINKPVLAAGGIADGKAIKAMLVLGADAVQIGTAFIASPESKAIAGYKEELLKSTDTSSELTRTFSGRWARGIRNKFMKAVDASGLTIPPYPIQNSLTTKLRAVAQKMDNKDFTNLWAGQSSYKAEAQSTRAIFIRLLKEMQE
jgi:nitronate monooxygenase